MKKIIFLLLILFVLCLSSCAAEAPYIGENGNWWIGDTDLGVSAQGPEGEKGEQGEQGESGESGDTPYIGENGNWWIGDTDLGVSAQGPEGEKGEQGEQGESGNTPYIGENGNWWIGDTDLGVSAQGSKETPDDPEDRVISDGLYFEIKSIYGKAGMVVTDYTGSDTFVVIPNYVGSVPVIAIEDEAFRDDTKITGISLSKNTVYIAPYAFEDCTSLEEVDFNDAQLTTIESYTFRNCSSLTSVKFSDGIEVIGQYAFANCTSLTKVQLSSSTTTLATYAFKGCPISSINLNNITYFGDYCLEDSVIDYVYLDKKVEYMGKYTFTKTYVFIEHEVIPETWGDNVAGDSFYASYIIANAKISGDYIYSVKDGKASLNRYLGTEKRLVLPSTIDFYPVNEVGYGFGSRVAVNSVEELRESSLIEVVIPSSVTRIEYCAFVGCSGTLIYIPSSVNIMSGLVGYGSNDCYAGIDSFCNYLVFESSALPNITSDEGLIDKCVEKGYVVENPDSLCDSEVRYITGISYESLVYDEQNEMYYKSDLLGYSLLAYMGIGNENLVIPSSYNGKSIHTIEKNCIYYDYFLKHIEISSGIVKVKSNGIRANLSSIYIPSSVTIINQNGIYNSGVYYIEAKSKPDEWDSNWNNGSNGVILFDCDDSIGYYNYFVYKIENNEISLLSYHGESSTIKIPREINGYKVTKICSGFLSTSGYIDIYIPSEVVIIEEKAIVNTGTSYFYLYCERSEAPSTWHENWYICSYRENNRSYVYKYWSRTLSY